MYVKDPAADQVLYEYITELKMTEWKSTVPYLSLSQNSIAAPH